jgi:hypothetical protein
MPTDDKILNPADFKSIKLRVSFQNTSSGSRALDPSLCSLVEIGEKFLVVELPYASCNKNHNVILKISVAEDGVNSREILSVTGKVIQMKELKSGSGEDEKKTLRVGIECIQFDELSWQELTQLYANRQEAITKFLKAARGY